MGNANLKEIVFSSYRQLFGLRQIETNSQGFKYLYFVINKNAIPSLKKYVNLLEGYLLSVQ